MSLESRFPVDEFDEELSSSSCASEKVEKAKSTIRAISKSLGAVEDLSEEGEDLIDPGQQLPKFPDEEPEEGGTTTAAASPTEVNGGSATSSTSNTMPNPNVPPPIPPDEGLGDWFVVSPALIAAEDDPLPKIIKNAKDVAEKTAARLNGIFFDAIDGAVVPTHSQHPINYVFEALKQTTVPVRKKPKNVQEVWRAERLASAIVQSCCLMTRYADKEGEAIATGVSANRNKVDVFKFIRLLDESGTDFIRIVRQMLILVWKYGIKGESKIKILPVVVAIFSGQHSFKYSASQQLGLLWLRAIVIQIIPLDYPNRERIIRMLASICPMHTYMAPQIATLFDMCPVRDDEQINAYVAQMEEFPWAFESDGCHESMIQWTTNLFNFDVVTQAYKTHPENYKEEIAKREHERNEAIKHARPGAPGARETQVNAAAAAASKAPVKAGETTKPAEEKKKQKKEAEKEPAPQKETPKSNKSRVSASLLNHQNQQKAKEAAKTPAPSRKKSVSFDVPEKERSYVDPRTHAATLTAAGKGYAPLPGGFGQKYAIGKTNADANHHHSLQQHLMQSQHHHSLPASSRAYSQMRMYSGMVPPHQPHGAPAPEHDRGSDIDFQEEDDEFFMEKRQERMDNLHKRWDMMREEKLLLEKFREDEARFKETQHRLATRHPDGGRQMINNAFSIECTYAQPVTSVNPKNLVPDPLRSLRRKKKPFDDGDESKPEDPNERKKYEQYFEAAVTGSHRWALNIDKRIPVEYWPQVLTVSSDKARVLNPWLWREIYNTIASYYTARMHEKDEYGDFECPPIKSELLFGIAQRSTILWLEEQFDEEEGETNLEHLTTHAQNLVYRKKPYQKAVDKAATEEKVTWDKSSSFYPLGVNEKSEIAEAYEDVIKRGVMNVGTLYISMKIHDHKTYSGLRIAIEKMQKDVRPFSSKNHLNPQEAPDKNATTLATKYTIPNVLTMLVFMNGYYKGSKETLITRLQDLSSRWNSGEGLFVTKCKKRVLSKLYMKFQDQLAQHENKQIPIEDLIHLLEIWMGSVPKTKNAVPAPKAASANTQHPADPEPAAEKSGKGKPRSRARGRGGGGGGDGGQANYWNQSWDQLYNQWGAQHQYAQWNQQQWPNQWQGQGKGGTGKGGGATLGPMPNVDEINNPSGRRPPQADVSADDTKIRKTGDGDRARFLHGPEPRNPASSPPLKAQKREHNAWRVAYEKARLDGIVAEWTHKRDEMERKGLYGDAEWKIARKHHSHFFDLNQEQRDKVPPHPTHADRCQYEYGSIPGFFDHPTAISQHYLNYDKEYGTRLLSPCFMGMIAEHLGFMSPVVREMVYGKQGHMNLGFPVEGVHPPYGVWPDAKPLTKAEKDRMRHAETHLAARKAHLDLMAKMRNEPYAFETGQTTEACYKNVCDLFAGPHADRVTKSQIPPKTWVWPFFGLGQKLDIETGLFKKVRPIANEKLRNDKLSPLVEHLTLPGTPTLVDMILYSINPTVGHTIMQTKDDITDTIKANRKEAGTEKMRWRDTSRLHKSLPPFEGVSFVPCFGKLDLYQAYQQLAVRYPNRNFFQVYNPHTKKYECGKLSCMSFGNIHSVFGFVGSVSEFLNYLINDLLKIPCVVYVDDIIFMCAEDLLDVYMDSIRKILALCGIAVEPKKCEVAKKGTPIELLGVDFTSLEDEVQAALSEKKIAQVDEKVQDLWQLLDQVASNPGDGENISETFDCLEELNGLFIHSVVQSLQNVIPPEVFKAHGWKLAHELRASDYDRACGKNCNHYNGPSKRRPLEYWEKIPEDPKRPRAANLVPRSISMKWKIPHEVSLFIWPEEAGHSAIDQRNSRWRVWMFYCFNYLPQFFWEPALITNAAQYEALRAAPRNCSR
eukprot:g1150.t1